MSGWFTTKDGRRFSPEQRRISARKTKDAITRGEIPLAKKCNRCAQTQGIIQYHNHDYADPIKFLEPLCWRCHMVFHSESFSPKEAKDYFESIGSGKEWPPIGAPDLSALERDHGIIRPKRKTLKIVIWNCAQSFHTKYQHLINQLDPDVAIIPECAHPDILIKKKLDLKAGTFHWFGENSQKGLGIFTFNDYRISGPIPGDLRFKWLLPVSITGPQSFNLIGVWARYHEAKRSGAQGPVLDFLELQKEYFKKYPTVIAGDFNSSIKFKRGLGKHKKIVETLTGHDFVSAYHHYYDVKQGDEKHPTIYWRDRKKDGDHLFHIDYCFIPTDWCPSLRYVCVGDFDQWGSKSDHMPVLFEIDLP